jgi:uncharacterized membrane protein YedE/YeeE
MDIDRLLEHCGEPASLALAGLLVGALFGLAAQTSRFCLRSASLEFWRRRGSEKIAVWLLAFAAALCLTQTFSCLDLLDASSARQLANRGSLSGALIGGLLFGCGMILARGCASRMLVLAANGNLRALLAGLVFAVSAQAAQAGILAPLRQAFAALWTVDANARDLLAVLGIGHAGGLLLGLAGLLVAAGFVRHARLRLAGIAGGLGVGIAVALAWLITYQIAQHAFMPVPVEGISFTGPSAAMLMRILLSPDQALDFASGLVPGVVLGSFLAAWKGGELKLEGFKDGAGMRRSILGAVMMGFGGMLAGGCAVGAGISGTAVFALTAWLALTAMWLAAGLTDRWVDCGRD